MKNTNDSFNQERIAFNEWLRVAAKDPTWKSIIKLWNQIDHEIDNVPVPACTLAENTYMTWNYEKFILTIEFEINTDPFWMARDKVSDTTAFGVLSDNHLDPKLCDLLRQIRDFTN